MYAQLDKSFFQAKFSYYAFLSIFMSFVYWHIALFLKILTVVHVFYDICYFPDSNEYNFLKHQEKIKFTKHSKYASIRWYLKVTFSYILNHGSSSSVI